MAKEVLKLEEFTPEKIAELKEKHGKVIKITVASESQKFDPFLIPDEDAADLVGKTIYLRKPNDREMNFALSKMPAMFDAGKVIVKNCFLGGDADVLTDEKMLTSAAMEACSLIEIRKSQLKEV